MDHIDDLDLDTIPDLMNPDDVDLDSIPDCDW